MKPSTDELILKSVVDIHKILAAIKKKWKMTSARKWMTKIIIILNELRQIQKEIKYGFMRSLDLNAYLFLLPTSL